MVSFTNYFVVLQGSEWCQKAQFSEMMYYDNVCSEKKNTKRSSNTLLCLVLFFSERTLDHILENCIPMIYKIRYILEELYVAVI